MSPAVGICGIASFVALLYFLNNKQYDQSEAPKASDQYIYVIKAISLGGAAFIMTLIVLRNYQGIAILSNPFIIPFLIICP